jgi:signal transduction histidine kinase
VQIDGPTQLQWLLRDISERKKLDSLRNDLLAMIYHDLRSPLNNIVSSLDVMGAMLGEQADPTQRSLLNIALRSTERIQRLTSSLLDIRRMENGQPLGNRQSTPILALVTDAIEVVRPLTDNKKQSLVSQVPEGLPDIWIDAEMVRRVLINLLENAHKYSPVGSQIKVAVEGQGDWVQFSVIDDGPGIPADEHERIFEKFIRLNTGEGPKGMGLGLSFCRLAVEGHGGRIWVESEPGAGACFKFTLPVVEQVSASPQA